MGAWRTSLPGVVDAFAVLYTDHGKAEPPWQFALRFRYHLEQRLDGVVVRHPGEKVWYRPDFGDRNFAEAMRLAAKVLDSTARPWWSVVEYIAVGGDAYAFRDTLQRADWIEVHGRQSRRGAGNPRA